MKKRVSFSFLLVFIFVFFLFQVVSETTEIKFLEAKVVRVIDGDTIEVILQDIVEKVRFIGVNCPESTIRLDPYGKEASDFTKKWLTDRKIYLEFDVQQRDHYGRFLAYIWLEPPKDINEEEIRNKMFNAILLLEGYAQIMTIPPNVRYVDYFVKFQKEARESNKGLWKIVETIKPKSEKVFSEELTRIIREDLEKRKVLINSIYTFDIEGSSQSVASYVSPEGIIIVQKGRSGSSFSIENFILLFTRIADAFANSNYPKDININIYMEIPQDYSLIVKLPVGIIYEYLMGKISDLDLRKNCLIYLNGIKIPGEKIFLYYVGSVNSNVVHYPWCRYVDRIKEENKIYFKSMEEAISKGYRSCEECKP